MLEHKRAKEILHYLRKFGYASRDLVVWEILAYTGFHIGTLQRLDVEDFRPGADIPHFVIRHRQESVTPLKNSHKVERLIAIEPITVEIIEDYLDHRPQQRKNT